MFLHVEHAQAMHRGTSWCGVPVTGPRIVGVENFLYHTADPKAGAVCERCIEAVLDRIGLAIRRMEAEKARGEACSLSA